MNYPVKILLQNNGNGITGVILPGAVQGSDVVFHLASRLMLEGDFIFPGGSRPGKKGKYFTCSFLPGRVESNSY